MGSRSLILDTKIFGSILHQGSRLGMVQQTLTGTTALGANSPPLLFLATGGAGRTVKLPPSPKPGQFHIIVNTATAAEVITVQDSAGVGLTPACTPTQNETALVFYVDAVLGWRNFVAIGV